MTTWPPAFHSDVEDAIDDVSATYQPLKDGSIETFATSGLDPSAFGQVVIGTLGDDLYIFGSESETAGTLAGVTRVRDGVATYIGSPTGTPDFNRLSPYGAVEFRGNLYVGDRRSGNLYKLILSGDTFVSLDSVGVAPSNEDVFPGPVLWNKLWLGSYGRDAAGGGLADANCQVMYYDGTSITSVVEFGSLGGGAEVLSMVVYDGELWVTVATKTRSACELWVINADLSPRRVWNGTVPYRICDWQGDLVGCVASYDNVASPLPQFVVFYDDDWVPITPTWGATGAMNGLQPAGDTLFAFHYYEGIYRLRDGTVTQVATAPPRIIGSRLHKGYLWMVGSQPTALYRMRMGTERTQRALAMPQRSLGSRVQPVTASTQDSVLALSPTLWLKNESLSALSDTNAVATWPDSSGHGYDVAQATSGNRPTYRTNQHNSLPGVVFDGTNDWLSRASTPLNGSNAATIFAVARLDTAGSYGDLFSWGGTELELRHYDTTRRPDFTNNANSATSAVALALASVNLWSAVYNGTADTIQLWINKTSVAGPSSAVTNLNNPATIGIGARSAGVSHFGGAIFELLLFPKALTTTQRQLVENYLQTKWATP